MPGIRVHHREKVDCKVEIPHPGGNGRKPKSYFIDLDHEGNAIVSETIWHRLQEAFAALQMPSTFLILNAVQSPPDLVLNSGTPPSLRDKRVYLQTDELRDTVPLGERGDPHAVRGNRS